MSDQRRDPFAGLTEPAQDLGLIPNALLNRPGRGGRRTPIRPTEKKRKSRMMSVTFSDSFILDRLRALAERWGMIAPDGRSPNVSGLVEYLLLPQLEAAERGQIAPPEEAG